MLKHQQTIVTADQAGRVDLVVQKLTGKPRRQLRGIFDHEAVKVNGQVCTEPFMRVAEGDRIEVEYQPDRKYAEKPRPWRDSTFTIVYEDEHLLVVDKAPEALTVPAGSSQTRTLIQRVGEYLTARGGGRHKRAYVCHRLDRGVSGLLVVAKTQAIQEAIRTQFESRKPKRRYLALVAGILKDKRGTFRSYLTTGADLTRYSTANKDEGELAITHFTVEQKLDGAPESSGAATLVSVELETGRRNQIRVHFAEAGHPVIGDPRYQRARARHPRWRVKRIALHAAELGFQHPVTDEQLQFTSPMPEPFTRFIAGQLVAPRRVRKWIESRPRRQD